MITVHNLNNSRSNRIIWLLEELGLTFTVQQYNRQSDSLAPQEYRKLHPLGKAPVVTDGDQVLVESGAIMETILERHGMGRLQPERGTPDWVRYTYWMHACEGSLMPLLLLKLILDRMESKAPFLIRPIIKMVTSKVKAAYVMPTLKKFMDYLNDALAGSQWLAGDLFSGADIMMGYPTEVALMRGGLEGPYPHITAYVERFKERPAYKTAMEKNGPFTPLT